MNYEQGYGMQTARLWVCMLREGGRWSARDLAVKAGMQAIAPQVSQLLSAMLGAGQVKRYPVPHVSRRYVYGVTGDCNVPRRVTVGQVAASMAEQPGAAE